MLWQQCLTYSEDVGELDTAMMQTDIDALCYSRCCGGALCGFEAMCCAGMNATATVSRAGDTTAPNVARHTVQGVRICCMAVVIAQCGFPCRRE